MSQKEYPQTHKRGTWKEAEAESGKVGTRAAVNFVQRCLCPRGFKNAPAREGHCLLNG